MNYYEHHIGDYAEATAHLSFVEDAAYCRLLRKYYATERALPSDIKALQRLVGARTRDERAAVETVLKEFFELREDGWHNGRADEEIKRYVAGEPEREARRSNEELRVKRHREERARIFRQLNAAGVTAPWNISMGQLRALWDEHCSGKPVTAPVTLQVRKPVTPVTPLATALATPATATQSPVSSPHTPDTNPNSERERRARAPEAPRETPPTRLTNEARWQELQAIRAAYPEGGFTNTTWQAGERAYDDLRTEGVMFETLLEAVRSYAAQVSTNEKQPFTPANFFGKGHWRGPFDLPQSRGERDRAAQEAHERAELDRLTAWAEQIGCPLRPSRIDSPATFETRVRTWRSMNRGAEGPTPIGELLKHG